MKFDKIKSLCKKKKHIVIYNDYRNNVQWISDGVCMFPMYNMPKMNEDNIFTVFDIGIDDRSKYYCDISDEMPPDIDVGDTFDDEKAAERIGLSIGFAGEVLIPIATEYGAVFINSKYLDVCSDIEEKQLYLRMKNHNVPYIAIKDGFVLLGIVLPMKVIGDIFNDKFRKLAVMTETAQCNSFCVADREENHDDDEQTDMTEDL